MMGLNNLAVDIPRVGSSCPLFPGWIEIQNVGFWPYIGRKREDPEKNPRRKEETNEKLNLRVTLGPWMEPRPQWFKASALNTAPPTSLPNIMCYLHKHITERKWIWPEWNLRPILMKTEKLWFWRNFLSKYYVKVGSKKNNAKAWKNKKREKINSNGTNTYIIILSFSRRWLDLDNRLVLAFSPL